MVKFLKVIPIALKKGTATIKYPYEKPLVTESFRGAIEVDPAKCIGCGSCTRICPPKALTLIRDGDNVTLRYFVGRCIFCGMCAEVCPEKAITITKEFELASPGIKDLNNDVVHETKKCVRCGSIFSTKKLYSKIMKEINHLDKEISELCPSCRRLGTLSKVVGLR